MALYTWAWISWTGYTKKTIKKGESSVYKSYKLYDSMSPWDSRAIFRHWIINIINIMDKVDFLKSLLQKKTM